MTATRKLYIYAENTTLKGRIYNGTGDEAAECSDVDLWGEGTDEQLIAQALDELQHRYDQRAGGSGDGFRWKCAREVLRHLDGPAVEYDAATRTYKLAADVADEG